MCPITEWWRSLLEMIRAVLDIAGIRGLLILGVEIAACGVIGWALDARAATAHRRAIRSMWRRQPRHLQTLYSPQLRGACIRYILAV